MLSTVLLSLVGLAAALPAPGGGAISMVGAPFAADNALASTAHPLQKREACTSSRACGRLAYGVTTCVSGQCVRTCNSGYVYNSATNTCTLTRVRSSTSASVAPLTVSSNTPKPTTSSTSVAAPSTTSSAPATTSSAAALTAVQQSFVDEHARFRALHGAQPLAWNTTLAAFAENWAALCQFKHSAGPYGENLSASAGGSPTPVQHMKYWEDEAPDYNPANPIYSHFTAMVWKSTTQVGCAYQTCPAGTIFDAAYGPSKFTVCSYSRNVPNSGGPDNYRLNVQP